METNEKVVDNKDESNTQHCGKPSKVPRRHQTCDAIKAIEFETGQQQLKSN
jgi:hypothetical protein